MKEQLIKRREAANLTQKEAAQKIGVGQSAISMWETGASNPRMERLERIASAYGCKIADLFGEEAS